MYRRERVAQFVREHRQELVLAAVHPRELLGLAPQLVLQLGVLGDVDRGAGDADDAALAVPQRLDREVVLVHPIGMVQTEALSRRLAGLDHAPLERLERLRLIPALEQVHVPAADDRLLAEGRRRIMDPGVAQVAVLLEDDEGRALQRRPEARFAEAQRLLDELALGDVLERAHHAHRPAPPRTRPRRR